MSMPLVSFLALASSLFASALIMPSVPLVPNALVLSALLLLLVPAVGGLVPLAFACCLPSFLFFLVPLSTVLSLSFLRLVGVFAMVDVVVSSRCCCVVVGTVVVVVVFVCTECCPVEVIVASAMWWR